ncbi:MAG: FecR family protein [Bacteroidota bacterium]
MKENIEQLIEKFWAGKASVEERVNLLALLNEDDRELREKLEASFLQREDPKIIQLVNGSVKTDLLKKIHREAGIMPGQEKPAVKRWSAIRFGIAASIIGAICMISWFTLKHHEAGQEPQVAEVSQVKAVDILNETSAARQITLPDQSKVILEPRGRIRYNSEFGKKTRDILLTGKARFSVFHDKTRPFTVFANGYSTTALGTEFIVNGTNGNTTVELLSGKVMVKDTNRLRMKSVYLKPGDELTLDNLNGKFELVNNLALKQAIVKRKATPAIQDQGSYDEALNFKVSPLNEVFAGIEKLKHIKIIADSTAIEGKVFTGTFLAEDSIETMLMTICEMNGLEYTMQQGQVLVKQK